MAASSLDVKSNKAIKNNFDFLANWSVLLRKYIHILNASVELDKAKAGKFLASHSPPLYNFIATYTVIYTRNIDNFSDY